MNDQMKLVLQKIEELRAAMEAADLLDVSFEPTLHRGEVECGKALDDMAFCVESRVRASDEG